ncbi:hypothetical protein ABZ917_36030 [Nonomuraea wenchangensis]
MTPSRATRPPVTGVGAPDQDAAYARAGPAGRSHHVARPCGVVAAARAAWSGPFSTPFRSTGRDRRCSRPRTEPRASRTPAWKADGSASSAAARPGAARTVPVTPRTDAGSGPVSSRSRSSPGTPFPPAATRTSSGLPSRSQRAAKAISSPSIRSTTVACPSGSPGTPASFAPRSPAAR